MPNSSETLRFSTTSAPAEDESPPAIQGVLVLGSLRSKALAAVSSEFGRNAGWFTALSAAERAIAVVQTILIARVLGITEYGVYGFLFGTIGFVASVLGLQMGLTATVYLSRFRATEKSRAAAVMSIVHTFGWTTAAAFVVATLPFSEAISRMLLGSGEFQVPLMLSVVFVGATIVSGVQDGIAQGFEIFGALARVKIVVSVLTLLSIYPAASQFGLVGVLAVILAGIALKYLTLSTLVARSRNESNIPKSGSGASIRELVSGFAIPAMAVSLGTGFMMWLGLYILSKQAAGFDQVAIVSAGLQWRGPVLLLAASLGGVAVPAFSRLRAQGADESSRSLGRVLALLNFAVASIFSAVVVTLSGWILQLYGDGFADNRMAFVLLVLSSVPTVIANVYLQELVGSARMWRQFWLHVPYLGTLGMSFTVLVPQHVALGYSLSLLLGSLVLLISVVAAKSIGGRSLSNSGSIQRP